MIALMNFKVFVKVKWLTKNFNFKTWTNHHHHRSWLALGAYCICTLTLLPQISKERTKSSYENLQKVGEKKWKLYTHTKMMIEQLISSINVMEDLKTWKKTTFIPCRGLNTKSTKEKQAYTIDWFWLKCKTKYSFIQLTNLGCLKHESMQINFIEEAFWKEFDWLIWVQWWLEEICFMSMNWTTSIIKSHYIN